MFQCKIFQQQKIDTTGHERTLVQTFKNYFVFYVGERSWISCGTNFLSLQHFSLLKSGRGGQEGVVNQRKVFQMFRKKIFDKVVEGGTTNSSQAKAELHQCMR